MAPRDSPTRPLAILLLAVTFATGLIDAISYLGLDRVFVANMTGNVVLLGFGLAGAEDLSVVGPFVALVAFVVGAFIGGRVAHRLPEPRWRWLAIAFGAQTVCLAGATIAAAVAGPIEEGPLQLGLIAVLGVGMGIQTATARALAVPDLNTAVITITLTGLAADWHLGGRSDPAPVRRVLAVLALVLGAVVGAVIITTLGLAFALAATTGVLLVASVGLALVARQERRPG
jgi:uncharacterized membrane protein YoaK (UPF0700 family)